MACRCPDDCWQQMQDISVKDFRLMAAHDYNRDLLELEEDVVDEGEEL